MKTSPGLRILSAALWCAGIVAGTPTPTQAAASAVSADKGFRWEQNATSLALLNDGKVVWKANFDHRVEKPFFHPIALPDGTEITALRPADHPWHLGCWWSWKFIDGLNYWETDPKTGQAQGLTEIVNVHCATNADRSARITMELSYRPPKGLPVLKEERIVEFSAPDAAGAYRINWECTFSALDRSVVLGRTPIPGQTGGVGYGGYAGLSLRLAAGTKSWVFTNSEGARGEKAVHGQPARWVDFSGKTTGGTEGGVAILDHPANLRYPTPWYVNQDMPYFSPALLFNEPYTLPARKTLALRYRIIIHAGLLSRAALDREWDDFCKIGKP